MMRKSSYISVVIISLMLLIVAGALLNKSIYLSSVKNLLASVFFVSSTSTENLLYNFTEAKKDNGKIKILIVPGHDEGVGGTQFRNTRERDLNIKIATTLTKLLRQRKEFDVHLTRNKTQYHTDIQEYITDNREGIESFFKKHKKVMRALVQSGLVDIKKIVEHTKAPSDTVLRLYGINKWANENDVDMVLHLHLNDYPGRKYGTIGKYSGIAIYVPERQFSNSKASIEIAENVMTRLATYSASSDMPLESTGIIEDQELIAIGAFNTLDPAVLLIEYGYIYETQFIDEKIQPLAIKELATQTYIGILDFFNGQKRYSTSTSNATLPYTWNKNLRKSERADKDIFALQIALTEESVYPPKEKTKNDCPINGTFGPCTLKSVIEFQKKYNIKPYSGFVGPITRNKLNELFNE